MLASKYIDIQSRCVNVPGYDVTRDWFVDLQYMLYRSLGTCLVLAAPPAEQRLSLLNDTWKVVMKLKQPAVRSL